MSCPNFTAPTPPGVTCECEVECACVDFETCPHEPSHWHQRFMGARCDDCGADFQADVFAYTRADALEAITTLAQERGWKVNRAKNRFACTECEE